jgi:hypothetical protein
MKSKTEKFESFWVRENHDRPLIAFTGSYFIHDKIEVLNTRGDQVNPEDIDIPAFLAQCQSQYYSWNGHTGDGIFSVSPLWGLPWIHAILGLPVYINKDSIWSGPTQISWQEIFTSCELKNNPWLDKLLELSALMVRQVGGEYPMSTLITPGASVILSELRGLMDFVYDLIDSPDIVEKAFKAVTGAYLKILNLYFETVPAWHGGYGSETRFVWAPGRMIEYDEDSNYLFSPELHQRFILPSHKLVAKEIEYAYCHLHSTQLHTLDNLLADDQIANYELCPDEGYDIEKIIQVLRKIQKKHCVITHAFFSVEDVNAIIESVQPEGLYIAIRVKTIEEADAMKEEIMGKRGWS